LLLRLVSLAIGVLAAGFVAWFVSRRMVESVTRIRNTTRSGGTDGDWGWVSVEDDGGGINAEDLPHVFDRFFRSAGSRRRAGSGLGLALSRGLVEAHDGELIAASDGPGRGARFTLRLPLI
jgi:signal transduction histidine kinase